MKKQYTILMSGHGHGKLVAQINLLRLNIEQSGLKDIKIVIQDWEEINKLKANQIKGRCNSCRRLSGCTFHAVAHMDYCSAWEENK
jgi:hypothetical protein